MKKYIKTIASASLYAFLAVAGIYASEEGKPSQEEGVVFLTSSEKNKLKAVFEADSKERTAKLQQAKELLKKLVDVEKRKPDDKQVRAMNNNIANMEKRIATNTKLTDDMIKTGKYSYAAVVQQLQLLGKTPQDVLQAPGIRGNFFAGERFARSSVETLLVTMDALNPKNPKADLEQAFRRYTKSQKNIDTIKKFNFICEKINSLMDEYKNRKLGLRFESFKDSFPKTLLADVISIFEEWLTIFKSDSKILALPKAKQKLSDASAILSNLKTESQL